jgi:acyl dehydratase
VSIELRAPRAPTLKVGSELDVGSTVITREEILDFARRWDPLPIHVDEELAASGPFRGLIASGLHTFVAAGRLMTDGFMSVYPVVVGRGFRELKLLKPVRPGTEISVMMRIEELELLSRDRVDVVFRATATDSHGEQVLSLVGELIAET